MPVLEINYEADLSMITTPVQEKNDRPYYPYSLMMINGKSEIIEYYKIMHPCPELVDMFSKVPAYFCEFLLDLDERPGNVFISSTQLIEILKPLCDDLGIELKLVHSLPIAESVRDKFFNSLEKSRY
jgi:hypothetical protein